MTRPHIVDSSVVVQRLIRTDQTPYVKSIFLQLAESDELVIPEFCLLECTNVLWKYVRFQDLEEETAESLVDDVVSLPLTIYASSTYLKRALIIGVKHQLAVYDSVYIALAEQLEYPLITDDGKQADVARAENVTLKPLTDFEYVD